MNRSRSFAAVTLVLTTAILTPPRLAAQSHEGLDARLKQPAQRWEEVRPGLKVNVATFRDHWATSFLAEALGAPPKAIAEGDELSPWEAVSTLRFAVTLPLAPIPRAGVPEKGQEPPAVRRSLVVGKRTTEAGDEEWVAGIRFDVDDSAGVEGLPHDAFVPLMRSADQDLVLRLSTRLSEAHRESFSPQPSGGFPDPKAFLGSCEECCFNEHNSDVFLCEATEFACKTAVTGAAMTCVVGCFTFIAGGPAWLACVGACGVGDIGGLLLCILQGQSCLHDANAENQDCLAACAGGGGTGGGTGGGGTGGGTGGGGTGGGTGGGGGTCTDCICDGFPSGEVCGNTTSELVDACVDVCGGFF